MQPSRHYIQANLTELNESLALLVELDNKIPQSLFLIMLPFSQITISLLYSQYYDNKACLTEQIDSQISWWAKRLLLSWWANRFLKSLCSLWLSKNLLSSTTTDTWLRTGTLGRTLPQLVDSEKALCQVWLPQTQQGFAEPSLHKLSKDLLSRYSTHNIHIHGTGTQCRRSWVWLHDRYVHHIDSVQKILSWTPRQADTGHRASE